VRISVAQLCSSDDPEQNLTALLREIRAAEERGVELFCTPEVTNCVSTSRTHQNAVLYTEEADPFLLAVREQAQKSNMAVALGSLALKLPDDSRFANRSFVISAEGEAIARYDKIHMFDAQISDSEGYRESEGFRAGSDAVIAKVTGATLGLSICYDLRFPSLYRMLAQYGADVLLVPSAFTVPTGRAHWEPLLRARAIENGCFVVAAAQTGTHARSEGRARETYGHSMIVSPWGEVLLDAGREIGVYDFELDLAEVAMARKRIPSLSGDRDIKGP